MKKNLLLLLLFCGALHAADAGRISGHIVDAVTGQPLPGANIQITGSVLGAMSDNRGHFLILRVPEGRHTLRVSYIGYEPGLLEVTLAAADSRTVQVRLKPTVIPMHQVVVTGSRQPETLASAAASISVMDRMAIRRRNLLGAAEALQLVSGVTMVGDYINIRGGSGYNRLGGSRLLVLLDEVPILTSDLGEANWNIVPVTEIERMEVLKGAASSLYGSGAISGVVNMITKQPSSELSLSVRQASGLFDTPSVPEWKWTDKSLYYHRTDLSASKSFGPVGVRLAVSRHASTGDRENGHFERWYLTGKAVWQLPSNASLTLFSTYSHEQRDIFLQWLEQNRALNVPATDRGDQYTMSGYVGYLVYSRVFSPKMSGKFRLSFNQQLVGVPFNITSAFTPAIGASGEGQVSWHPSPAHRLSMGVDYKFDTVESEYYGRRNANGISPYIQEIWQVSNLLHLNAGLRWDTYQLVGDSLEYQVSPKIGFSWQPAFGTILHGSFGRGFRAATVVERFITAGAKDFKAIPNPDLEPERSILLDVGVRQTFDERVYVEATYFFNRYANLIEPTLLASQLAAQFVNYPVAYIQGIETEMRTRFWRDRVSLQASATWMDPRDKQTDATLLYRPRFIASFSPQLNLGRFTAGADYRYIGRIEKVAVYPLDERVPAKIWDARIGWRLQNWEVQLVVRNALNYNYTVSERVLGEIRNFMLAISGEI
ncbi:MAG TPA: TonB-dependent receptor [bacterium]|nr:TonB-dependent receptor [bacterium]HPR89348.1 TonB-dependent receptor [bacterium]